MTGSRTVLFWGAGATESLGLRTTAKQAQFLRRLAPGDPGNSETASVRTRVRTALGDRASNGWVDAFSDLLQILGDRGASNGQEVAVADINAAELDAMARNWGRNDKDQLRNRIVELRSLYDWPALVAAINVCPHAVQPNPVCRGAHDCVRRTPALTLWTSSTFWICTAGAVTDSRTEKAGSSHRSGYWVPAGRWDYLSSRCSMSTGTSRVRTHAHSGNHHYDFATPSWAEGCSLRVSGSPQRPVPAIIEELRFHFGRMSAS